MNMTPAELTALLHSDRKPEGWELQDLLALEAYYAERVPELKQYPTARNTQELAEMGDKPQLVSAFLERLRAAELDTSDSVMPIIDVLNSLNNEHIGDLADYIGKEGKEGICLALNNLECDGFGNQVGFERLNGMWTLVVWGDLSNRMPDIRQLTIPSRAAADAHPVEVAKELDRLINHVVTLDMPPDTLGGYFKALLGPEANDYETEAADWELTSVCGEACKDIIDRAAALLAVCDTHEDVRTPIIAGVFAAIQIICFA